MIVEISVPNIFIMDFVTKTFHLKSLVGKNLGWNN